MTVPDETLDAAARVVAARLNRLCLTRDLVNCQPWQLRRADAEVETAERELVAEADRLAGRD